MDEKEEVVSWDPYESFQAFLHAPAYHLAIEGCLIIWVLWLIFHKSYKPEPELTEKVIHFSLNCSNYNYSDFNYSNYN